MSAARTRAVQSGARVSGAVKVGLVAGVVFVVVAVAALAYLRASDARFPFERPREISRVLVIVALPDENGAVVAQAIAEADLDAGSIASVDPSMPVTIPGTSYSALRDAYSFGGGAGVAEHLAQARGGKPLPYLAFDASAAEKALSASGGVTIDLPESMSVFDGERLYDWGAGPAHVTNVSDLRAIVNGAAYLTPGSRELVLQQVAKRAVAWVASYPGGLANAIQEGVVESDLSAEEAVSIASTMAALR